MCRRSTTAPRPDPVRSPESAPAKTIGSADVCRGEKNAAIPGFHLAKPAGDDRGACAEDAGVTTTTDQGAARRPGRSRCTPPAPPPHTAAKARGAGKGRPTARRLRGAGRRLLARRRLPRGRLAAAVLISESAARDRTRRRARPVALRRAWTAAEQARRCYRLRLPGRRSDRPGSMLSILPHFHERG